MARDPKGKNKKRLLSPPRDGGENEGENIQKMTDFFYKFQSLITRFISRIIQNGKNGLEI